ncbi:hypothetical protein ACQKWADRAFT_299970 [Trichoderma austrokoningii]
MRLWRKIPGAMNIMCSLLSCLGWHKQHMLRENSSDPASERLTYYKTPYAYDTLVTKRCSPRPPSFRESHSSNSFSQHYKPPITNKQDLTASLE